LNDEGRTAIIDGILNGRDGKGTVYVFSSGNEFDAGADTNYDGLTNSRFIITVGALGKDGFHASYSNPGASLFITGPGGDFETEENHIGVRTGGECGDAGVGTSFSCPVVSGVIALMLEANPDLSWRDVQGILATTSRSVEDTRDDTATTNAAGIWHSNLYGFGIVDAYRAVRAAEYWRLLEPERVLVGNSGFVNRPIFDDPSFPTYSVLQVKPRVQGGDFIAESVAIYLDLKHFSRGHLEVVLTSPQNTESVLLPGSRPENTILEDGEAWKVLTVRNWGESAIGKWYLRIRDTKDGDVSDCADLPFSALVDGWEWSCSDLDVYGACFDGLSTSSKVEDEFFDLEYNGRTAEEACCSCGGGASAEGLIDQLLKWRIVVFGRDVPPERQSRGIGKLRRPRRPRPWRPPF
jgi:subtilisin-like proprotein convertase family protein